MNNTNQEKSVRQYVIWLLFTLFGCPCFGLCMGFAAYHFHLLEAIKSRHMEQQFGIGLSSIVVTVTVLLIFAISSSCFSAS